MKMSILSLTLSFKEKKISFPISCSFAIWKMKGKNVVGGRNRWIQIFLREGGWKQKSMPNPDVSSNKATKYGYTSDIEGASIMATWIERKHRKRVNRACSPREIFWHFSVCFRIIGLDVPRNFAWGLHFLANVDIRNISFFIRWRDFR